MIGFLDLPPELRLHVYHHAVIASMADGRAGDIGALLFTCRTAYRELRADYILAVTPILEAMRMWTATYSQYPLKIQLPHNYDFKQPPTEATINFPYTPLGLEEPGYVLAIARLQPLLSRPWNSITFCMYMPTSHMYGEAPAKLAHVDPTFRSIFTIIARNHNWKNGTQNAGYFSATKRVVLRWNTRFFNNFADYMSELYKEQLTRLLPPPRYKEPQAWIGKKIREGRQTWTLGYDLGTLA